MLKNELSLHRLNLFKVRSRSLERLGSGEGFLRSTNHRKDYFLMVHTQQWFTLISSTSMHFIGLLSLINL